MNKDVNFFFSFQNLILTLQKYWQQQNCIIIQPIDFEVGAATFHPETFLRAIGPSPWNCVFTQACRRPTDSRYGENPNRCQHYYQMQVVLKPSPNNVQELYLNSLKKLKIDLLVEDIKFVEDNWESPTLGSWGVGWEVWQDGLEITQFTYFQQVGGINCNPITCEITYGLERLAMFLQKQENIFDLIWANNSFGDITYGDLFRKNELEMSKYNLEYANTNDLLHNFDMYEKRCKELLEMNPKILRVAYQFVLKISNIFNILDARRAISVSARQNYILKIRNLACAVARGVYDETKT